MGTRGYRGYTTTSTTTSTVIAGPSRTQCCTTKSTSATDHYRPTTVVLSEPIVHRSATEASPRHIDEGPWTQRQTLSP